MDTTHALTLHSDSNTHTYAHNTQHHPNTTLTPHQLIAFTTAAIDAFEPTKTNIDAHSDAVTATLHDAEDRAFVQQVLYGTYRYKKLLRVLVSALYATHSGETQRSDRTLYIVVGYLATLRLSELTFADFRQLVLTQDIVLEHTPEEAVHQSVHGCATKHLLVLVQARHCPLSPRG